VGAKTILIVDDDAAFAQFLDELLTAAGYHCRIARHGAAAFADLEIVRPHLMLVDVFMPLIDGITLCLIVRADPATRDMPIVVMSAIRRDIPIPIAGFLTKPLDIDALLHLVASLVEEPVTGRQAN